MKLYKDKQQFLLNTYGAKISYISVKKDSTGVALCLAKFPVPKYKE